MHQNGAAARRTGLRGPARALGLAALALALAACRPEPEAAAGGSFGPDLAAEARAACEREGGRWGEGPATGVFVCYRETRDGGRSCTASSECEGFCLARSRTCAPVTPLFGCHDVLTANGTPARICVD